MLGFRSCVPLWGRPSALEAEELKTPENVRGEEPVSSVGSRRGAFPGLGGGGSGVTCGETQGN